MSVCLEGTLQKWTNYVSGWQPRWFILEDGILSYYLSAQEVQQGCRGSVNVTSCDIIAHNKDNKRIDIVIPGERYIYLRMSTQAEKQKWLVALGSAKQDSGMSSSSEQAKAKLIRSQMLDLHLTCQRLVSHIATLKSSLANPTEQPNVKSLDELSLLLSTTCDSFLNILAECMDLSCDEEGAWPSNIKPLARSSEMAVTPPIRRKLPHLGYKYARNAGSVSSPLARTPTFGFTAEELYPPQPLSLPAIPKVSSPTNRTPKLELSLPSHLQGRRTAPLESQQPVNKKKEQQQDLLMDAKMDNSTKEKEARQQHVHQNNVDTEPGAPVGGSGAMSPSVRHQQSTSDLFMTPTSSPIPSPPPSPTTKASATHQNTNRHVETFFSKATHKFTDLKLLEDNGIPAAPFLQCCREILPFFDALSPTVFAPVKANISSDIEKVALKHSTSPQLFPTLQSIVLDDLRTGTHDLPESATGGLLWLKRCLEFIQQFLYELSAGQDEVDVAAVKAYEKSLSRHHNFVVRGLFYLGVKAAPYRAGLLALLSSSDSPHKETVVIQDMSEFAFALGKLTTELNRFYLEHELETPP